MTPSTLEIRRGVGVTPHSEIIVGDEPPLIEFLESHMEGGHTPF